MNMLHLAARNTSYKNLKRYHDNIGTKAMTERWSETSRHGTLRIYVVNKSTMTVICHDITSYAFSLDSDKKVTSLDPDGGPYLSVGSIIRDKWTITRVKSHHKNKSDAMFVFEVQPST